MVLDFTWIFEEHVRDLKTKTIRRLAILNKVSNTSWGLEARILGITTHALIESVVNYGLATVGAQIAGRREKAIDTELLNRAARRAIGTGVTVWRVALHIMADTRTATNRHILRAANILDLTLRATGTAA